MPHYTLDPLTDGVYAAIASEGGSAIANAGIVDLGDATLIVDTFLTPTAAEDLRRDAERLTGRAPRWAVLTHYHNDHIWGAQAFLPEAKLVSSTATRQLIETAGKDELDEYRAIAADQLAAAQKRFDTATTDAQRSAATMWVGYYGGLLRDFPRLTLSVPTMLFERRMVLHGSQRRVELIAFDGAHTGSDAVVYLPGDGILFMSDLLFVGAHPYLGNGSPDRWQEVLASILDGTAGIDATRFVPGHGPVAGRDDVQRLIDYIADCKDIAARLGQNQSPNVNDEPIPARYADWALPSFFPANLTFLLKGEAKRY
jgi:glyoxylase-like metal-dependent hydrolase (beta-lactamase superfamily II)